MILIDSNNWKRTRLGSDVVWGCIWYHLSFVIFYLARTKKWENIFGWKLSQKKPFSIENTNWKTKRILIPASQFIRPKLSACKNNQVLPFPFENNFLMTFQIRTFSRLSLKTFQISHQPKQVLPFSFHNNFLTTWLSDTVCSSVGFPCLTSKILPFFHQTLMYM